MLQNLTLAIAQSAVQHALQLSQQRYGGRPLSVAVCDKSGFLLAFARMEEAKLLSIELTQRKAYTAARMGAPTHVFLQRLQQENLEISYFADDKFSAMPGGLPVFNADKQLIGALAIGGISAKEDLEAAELIVAALADAL
ncbi:MAG: heme-binding protein [Proteobacteria bacterium]|nr:heme-binding protein [Pseudomonadota bacterium]